MNNCDEKYFFSTHLPLSVRISRCSYSHVTLYRCTHCQESICWSTTARPSINYADNKLFIWNETTNSPPQFNSVTVCVSVENYLNGSQFNIRFIGRKCRRSQDPLSSLQFSQPLFPSFGSTGSSSGHFNKYSINLAISTRALFNSGKSCSLGSYMSAQWAVPLIRIVGVFGLVDQYRPSTCHGSRVPCT